MSEVHHAKGEALKVKDGNISYARVWFYLFHLIFYAMMAIMWIWEDNVTYALGAFAVAFCVAPLILLVRCERCKCLLFRKGKENFGFPTADYVFQGKNCPKCGMSRV